MYLLRNDIKLFFRRDEEFSSKREYAILDICLLCDKSMEEHSKSRQWVTAVLH